MRQEQASKTILLLRIGLAFVLAYAAVRAIINPSDWVGFVPVWVEKFGFTRDRFLFATSLVEIALSLLFLANFKTKYLALLTALFMVSIVVSSGIGALDLTFRDIGLFFASLALFYIL